MNPPVPVPANPHSDFCPSALSNDALDDAICELSACITVASWRLLMLIAELDSRGLCGHWGVRSCAHWLNWRCGIDMGAAREKVRVAKAIQSLPKISAAFSIGQLSYSKVRAMTRVATPQNEDYLLEIARYGTAAHVERVVRSYRRVERSRETDLANQAHAARELSWRYDEDGSLIVQVRLPGEQGAMVLKALEAAEQALPTVRRDIIDERGRLLPKDKDVSAETLFGSDQPVIARRADALCHLAEQFLAGQSASSQQAERYQVVVHVDRDALAGNGLGRCDIDHGPALAVDTTRRLACDASVVEISEDTAGQALDIGRKTRSVPAALRRALHSRDSGCQFPGCTHHRFVDAHHIEHWADGGPTSLANLALLCRYHHRLVHEGGFTIERQKNNEIQFLRPDGRPVPAAPPPENPWRTVEDIAKDSQIGVSAETGRTLWRGETLDIHQAMDGMLQHSPGGLDYVPPPSPAET